MLLKLPTTVRPVFLDWLERSYPEKSERVQSLIRSTRGGKLSDSQFGRRQVGTGNIAELIADTFELWRKKLGYIEDHPHGSTPTISGRPRANCVVKLRPPWLYSRTFGRQLLRRLLQRVFMYASRAVSSALLFTRELIMRYISLRCHLRRSL